MNCPVCQKELKLRKGKYGIFWGCSGYPGCSYTQKIEDQKDPLELEADKILKQNGYEHLTKLI